MGSGFPDIHEVEIALTGLRPTLPGAIIIDPAQIAPMLDTRIRII
jgi:hypothetical protein